MYLAAPVLRGRGNRRLPKEQHEAEKNLRCQGKLDESDEPLIGTRIKFGCIATNVTVTMNKNPHTK